MLEKTITVKYSVNSGESPSQIYDIPNKICARLYENRLIPNAIVVIYDSDRRWGDAQYCFTERVKLPSRSKLASMLTGIKWTHLGIFEGHGVIRVGMDLSPVVNKPKIDSKTKKKVVKK